MSEQNPQNGSAMHTYLTPDPITVEVRNTTGSVHIDLIDVATTTVDLVGVRSGGLGRWDDVVGDLFRSLSRGSWESPTSEPMAADAADPAELVRVEYQDTRGTLVVDTDPAQRSGKTAFTVRITAPLGSGVRVRTEAADVQVTGSSARAEIRTTSGDVEVDTVIGAAVVQTSSGSVRVKSATAGVDLRSTSGTLEVDTVGERAQIHTTSGGITVGRAKDDLSVRSVSGDVRVGSCRSGVTDITSVSGGVSVGIDTAVQTRLDLTSITGRATAEFEVADTEPAGDETDRTALALSVTTTSGDIRVHAA